MGERRMKSALRRQSAVTKTNHYTYKLDGSIASLKYHSTERSDASARSQRAVATSSAPGTVLGTSSSDGAVQL